MNAPATAAETVTIEVEVTGLTRKALHVSDGFATAFLPRSLITDRRQIPLSAPAYRKLTVPEWWAGKYGFTA